MKLTLPLSAVFMMAFLSTIQVNAKSPHKHLVFEKDSAVAESKVDYLEQIYFSGENKEGLIAKITLALYDMQDKAPTVCLAKQVTFLTEIKDKAIMADNSCDILEMVAVGIYEIDHSEATAQGVKLPSTKAKANSIDALGALNKLSSTSSQLGSSASNLAWSGYLLSNGKYNGYGAASKIGAAGNTIGSLGQAAQTGKDLLGVGKSLGIGKKKDKPCNDVSKKEIVISLRPALDKNAVANNTATATNNGSTGKAATSAADNNAIPSAAAGVSTITIENTDYDKLSNIKGIVENCSLVSGCKMKFDSKKSMLSVTHTGSTEDLWKQVSSACKKIFTNKNVTEMNEDQRIIALKL